MAEITMPQLGETVTEGTITRWFKKVGDTVAMDETLFEVSTDKVDTEVPSPSAGVLVEVRAAEGVTVAVGAVIAVLGPVGAEVAASPAPAPPAPAPPAPAPPAPAPESAPAPASHDAVPVEVAAPAVAVPTAVVVAPAPAVISRAVAVAERSTAAPAPTQPAPSRVAGANDTRLLSPMVRRLVNEHGLDLDAIVGTGVGGRITREDVSAHIEHAATTAAETPVPVPSVPTATVGAPTAPDVAQSSSPGAPGVTPAPASTVPSTTSTSTESATTSTSTESATTSTSTESATSTEHTQAPARTDGRDTTLALSKIRQRTGEHMVRSLAVTPHALSVVEVDYSNVDHVRNAHKTAWKAAEGFSLTYLPFISRALIDALADFPLLNASMGTNELIVHNFIDLGIAVDLDYQGLLVPVIRNAEGKRLRAIAREINDLANRARARKLLPDEIAGGTFTISNNGSAGSVLTAAIINQPQVAIVSTDAIARKPVVVELTSGDEVIAVHSVGNVTMSWDHRAFDGAYAAHFLVKVRDILETRDWQSEM
jgi:pyruvate dehydrogenase E2 component (dihydrolipoamide acetyltransferase)